MSPQVKREAEAIVKMYGKEGIERGFRERDMDVCRNLRFLGGLTRWPKDPDKYPAHILEFDAMEALRELGLR